MRSEDELARTAREICEEHAARCIRADLLVESGAARTAWDSYQLRSVFEQPFTIWRRVAAFEVILDSAGRRAGFVDHDKYSGAKDGVLTSDEVEAITAATEALPTGARLVGLTEARVPPDARVYRARYLLAFPLPDYVALDVEINPTRREVIAVRPVPKEG